MDMIEFAEKFMNVELKEWQKSHIRVLEKLPHGAKIVMTPRGRVYFYLDQPVKELTQNGETFNSSQPLSSMR